MAPDHTTLRSAVELARSDKGVKCGWASREHSVKRRLLWAELLENRRTAVHTAISLPDMHVTCTCFATRFPCRHSIALLLRDLESGVEEADLPEWVEAQFRRGQHETSGVEPAAEAARLAALTAGMADLQVWMGDLVRQGLATLPNRKRNVWLDAADRLVDAYAFDAARDLRECALFPAGGADWPEKLLPRLGKLALLCEAFRRFDELSPEDRGDALTAAGQPPHPGGRAIEDYWLVLGHRSDIENKQRSERTWLLGLQSGRWALLLDSAPVGRQDGVFLPTGAIVIGELAYRASNWPLMAGPAGVLQISSLTNTELGSKSSDVETAIAGYAAALAANPWLRSFPMALQDVFIEPPRGQTDSGWRIRDRSGSLLPLPDRFVHGWQLLALAAGRSFSIFGEWDGAVFTPLSVRDGGWSALSAWRGLA